MICNVEYNHSNCDIEYKKLKVAYHKNSFLGKNFVQIVLSQVQWLLKKNCQNSRNSIFP
jgi:hypothetical protein